MSTLNELIYLYAFLMLLNTVISIVLYKSYKLDLYKMSSILWLTYFVNFLTQAVLDSNEYLMVLGYSTYFAVAIVFRKILNVALVDKSLKDRVYYYIFTVCFGLFNLLYYLDFDFTIYALPMAFAVTAPMLNATFRVLGDHKEASLTTKFLCYFVILNSLHIIDYPFLRLSDFAIMGFTIAFVLIFTLSCILPAYVMSAAGDRYISKLETKLRSKNTEVNQAKDFFEVVDQKILSKLNDLKDSALHESMLLSSLAHDINGSLQIMLLSNSRAKKLLNNNEQPDKIIDHMDKIEKSVERISEMVKTVREVQKKSLQDAQVKPSVTCFKDIINALEESFTDALKAKQISIKYISEVTDLSFYGDRAILVNNILGNLLSNAIKFSHYGSLIRFELVECDDEYSFILTDRGVGIADTELESIFDIRQSSSKNGTGHEVGSGIGLALVKKYVDICDGKIFVRSLKGSGTIVTVKLKKFYDAEKSVS